MDSEVLMGAAIGLVFGMLVMWTIAANDGED